MIPMSNVDRLGLIVLQPSQKAFSVQSLSDTGISGSHQNLDAIGRDIWRRQRYKDFGVCSWSLW